MPPLDPKDFPDFKESTIKAINELSDAQLHVEIEKKANSRFGAKKQPLLRAALAQRNKEAQHPNTEISPEPPELLKNILWVKKYGIKYWYLLVIALIILLFPNIYNKYLSSSSKQQNNAYQQAPLKQQSQDNKDKKTVLSAPNIRFSDGTVGTVELSVQARLDPKLLVAAHALYGSAEAASNSLLTSLRSTTIIILETKSQEFVRLNREQLAKEIIEKTKEAQNRTGYIIIEFSIGKIY